MIKVILLWPSEIHLRLNNWFIIAFILWTKLMPPCMQTSLRSRLFVNDMIHSLTLVSQNLTFCSQQCATYSSVPWPPLHGKNTGNKMFLPQIKLITYHHQIIIISSYISIQTFQIQCLYVDHCRKYLKPSLLVLFEM